MTYRKLYEEVTDPAFVEALGDVSPVQVYKAMCSANVPGEQRREIMNRLHNMKHSDKAVEITASALTRQGFEKGAEITIPRQNISGTIFGAEDIVESGNIVVVVESAGRFKAHVLLHNELVQVWPVDRDKHEPRLNTVNLCGVGLYRCARIHGHKGQHTPFTREARVLDEVDSRPQIRQMPLQGGRRVGRLAAQEAWEEINRARRAKVVNVSSAEGVLNAKDRFVGRRVAIRGGCHTGVLTDVVRNPGNIALAIEGKIYKLTAGECVTIFPADLCMKYLGDSPDDANVELCCERVKGHSGHHFTNYNGMERTQPC